MRPLFVIGCDNIATYRTIRDNDGHKPDVTQSGVLQETKKNKGYINLKQ